MLLIITECSFWETLDHGSISGDGPVLFRYVSIWKGTSGFSVVEKQMAGVAGKVEVAALLGETAAICIPVLQKKGNDWEVRCGGNPSVSGNREMLLQVLINLVVAFMVMFGSALTVLAQEYMAYSSGGWLYGNEPKSLQAGDVVGVYTSGGTLGMIENEQLIISTAHYNVPVHHR